MCFTCPRCGAEYDLEATSADEPGSSLRDCCKEAAGEIALEMASNLARTYAVLGPSAPGIERAFFAVFDRLTDGAVVGDRPDLRRKSVAYRNTRAR